MNNESKREAEAKGAAEITSCNTHTQQSWPRLKHTIHNLCRAYKKLLLSTTLQRRDEPLLCHSRTHAYIDIYMYIFDS